MTLSELIGLIRGLGLPVAQISWDGSAPPVPYVLVTPETSADVMADGQNFYRRTPYRCDLYSRGRDMEAEAGIEDALTAQDVEFERRHVPIGGGILETAYTVMTEGR
jgi:hypothetical protein